jgi:DedD protein
MAKQPTDDEQNLKRKSRRRLVGAVALALAVIVILPMVLDSEPKPSGQDIDLRIPAPDKVGEFVPKVVVPKVAVELPASSAVIAPAVAPEVKPVETKEPAAKPPVEIVASPKEVTKPAVKDNKAKAVAESFVAQVGAYSNAESAHKVLVELKGWSFKAYSEKVGDKIRVRVGPYPEREKVEKVKLLLEKHGLHPVVVSLP